MRRYGRAIAFGLLGTAFALAVGVLAATRILPTTAAPVPRARADLTPTSTPASPDAAAITTLLVRSYAVRTAALKNFDTSQYPSVFIDDAKVPLSRERAGFVGAVRARYGAEAATLTGNGWLTYNRAEILDRQRSLGALARVRATASAQGRPLTSAELRSAVGVNGSVPPPGVADHPQKIILVKLAVDGDRATAEFDDGAITYRAALVRTADGWRIAGEEILNIHV